uniref:Uncharacterized protein n=2 Tax=viral metagenome TaxID=1070528 RepID=A0A6M3K5V8_9ZZZZ
MLLKDQGDVCGVTPMPTDRVDDTSRVATATSETVTWLYLSSGAYASATAQAAGTIVTGKLDYDGVTNSMGSNLGTHLDTSLSWGAATRLDSLATVPDDVLSKMAFMSPTDQIATITPYLTTNGEYIIDHRRGQIWAMPKATVADDAATYTYKVPLSTGSGSTVDITMVGGVAVPVEDAAVTSTGIHPLWESKDFDGSALPNATNEGDATRPATTLNGVPYGFLVNEDGSKTPVIADDSAQVATPEMINVGGEYRASATTYSDGDATILQTDVNGQLKVVLSSDIEIGAVEIKDGTTDARQAVKVDNATASATPTVALTGGIYKDALDTYADNDATPNHHDVNGQLLTTVNGLAGSVAHDAADAGNPIKIGGYAASSQRTAAAAADRVDAIFNLNGELVNAGYTWATSSNRSEEIDPISTHYLNESLLDTTNISAATHYYPSSTGASMDGYKGLSVTGKLIDADGTLTVTVEATNDEDTTSGDWEDVTATFIDTSDGAVGGAYTVTNGTLIFGFYNPDFNFRYYRIVVVADGATNTVILKTRKLY